MLLVVLVQNDELRVFNKIISFQSVRPRTEETQGEAAPGNAEGTKKKRLGFQQLLQVSYMWIHIDANWPPVLNVVHVLFIEFISFKKLDKSFNCFKVFETKYAVP